MTLGIESQNIPLSLYTIMAQAKKTSPVTKDLSTLTVAELQKELTTARKELFTLTMKHSLRELKQPHLIRTARRSVAQISTAIHDNSL